MAKRPDPRKGLATFAEGLGVPLGDESGLEWLVSAAHRAGGGAVDRLTISSESIPTRQVEDALADLINGGAEAVGNLVHRATESHSLNYVLYGAYEAGRLAGFWGLSELLNLALTRGRRFTLYDSALSVLLQTAEESVQPPAKSGDGAARRTAEE